MVLQILVALSSLSLLIPPAPIPSHETITISVGGRSISAEVFVPRHITTAGSRYPGAVIIGTEDTKERAMVVASRLSEVGVTVMMFMHDDYATYRLNIYDAKLALDSLRRRTDVRSEEVGVVAFEEATAVIPEMVRDTTLSFAIAASTGMPPQDIMSKYAQARAATLVVQGVTRATTTGPVVMSNITQVDLKTEVSGPITSPVEALKVGPNVTLWPVPKEQLESIGDTRSPLGAKVVGWVKEQVHVAPGPQQLPTVTIR